MSTTETTTKEAAATEDSKDVVVPSTSVGVSSVTIHPLVLLSAADHYHRVARGTRKRVVGVLLGQVFRGVVDVTNSFAVPFEEDSRNPAVFYLDHNYLENMLAMFRKVNAKERVVGYYSTGPQIRPNDLRIYDVVAKYCATPVFMIIDVRPNRPDLPVTAYTVVETVLSENNSSSSTAGASGSAASGGGGQQQQQQQSQQRIHRTFCHVPSQMGAQEAEEVGVEHLLRDINDPTVSTVASLIKGKLAGLATLEDKLVECQEYLVNNSSPSVEIVNQLQTIVHLLPNLNTQDLIESLTKKCNDMHMAIYLATVIRTVLALHDLVNNKIQFGQPELQDEKENVVVEEKKEDIKTKETEKKK